MSVKIPEVLSFQRGSIVTDGVFYSECTHQGEKHFKPVPVVRHGIRGTNINPKGDDSVALVQRTESAKTAHNATALVVRFAYKTISAEHLLFSCADSAYRPMIEKFIGLYFKQGVPEFDEVCRRLARNILNGRWLWRNQTLGEVTVTAKTRAGASFDGKGSRQRDFDDYTDDEKRLASEVIAAGLTGSMTPLTVEGRVDFGFEGSVEVYPSQNMVTDKPKGFARSLHKVDPISVQDLRSILATANADGAGAGEFCGDTIRMGLAALRDQKISNAIRTIDTWYPGYAGKPIPIEPNGASLDLNLVLRQRHGAAEFLQEIDAMRPGEVFNPDAAFLIAVLMRGGVFSRKKDAS